MVGMGLSAQNTGKITAAIDRMMQQFPETQLRDLYKSFFQDRFGLEHLMSDSAKADEYLRYELAHLEDENLYPDYEPTGYKENFYRVNLHLIRSGKIPYDVYFQAFMESAKAFSPISIEKWEKEWNAIESIIADHYPQLMESSDAAEIHALLDKDEYAMHHSKKFNAAYHPHYRIIEKKVFKKRLLPLLKVQ